MAAAGLPVQVPVFSTLTCLYFSGEPVADYDGAARAAESGLYAPFFRAMLEMGVALAPSPYEVIFCSLAHSEAEIDETIEKAAASAESLARRG